MLDRNLESAVEWLLEHQHPDGWWTDELETNVTMTAEHVLLLRFLGVPLEAIREGAIRHILHNQREDGTGRCTTTGLRISARRSKRTSRSKCWASTRRAIRCSARSR